MSEKAKFFERVPCDISAWDLGVPRGSRGRPRNPAMAGSGNNSNMLVKCETKSNRVKGLSFLDRYLMILMSIFSSIVP